LDAYFQRELINELVTVQPIAIRTKNCANQTTMKKTLITITALLAAAASYAQGSLNFTTKSGTAVDAPVLYQPATGAPVTADANFLGQLFWSNPGAASWAALGAPVPFRTGSGQGYITAGGVQTITGKFAGDKVDVQFRGWAAELGASAPGSGQGSGYNSSILANLTLGGGKADPAAPPDTPALLAGLAGFTIPTVPEPSFAALGLLGAGLLLIRRKK
jgi:hypothetical protein